MIGSYGELIKDDNMCKMYLSIKGKGCLISDLLPISSNVSLYNSRQLSFADIKTFITLSFFNFVLKTRSDVNHNRIPSLHNIFSVLGIACCGRVLSELALEIDQKSEILITVEEDLVNKEIDGNYLKKIFISVKQKEMFDEVLNNLPLNTLMKQKVRAVKLRIPLLHTTLKKKIKDEVNVSKIMSCSTDEEAIHYIKNLIKEDIATELSIALAIDCFCELEEV